jgi:hypothetical protein
MCTSLCNYFLHVFLVVSLLYIIIFTRYGTRFAVPRRAAFDHSDSQGWFTVGGKVFLLSTTSRPVLGPTQSPIQSVPGAVSREVKTFANYNYFYILVMPYLISRIPSL